ncbi:urea transporter [Mycetocola zhujimingii]|uniref:urea transporter n=1 Tax=Mycetocola zhujimingii TaxID=2079792 RepID=UPI000D3B4DAB|nr:urea transporter [Mycetocola zhujimingii]AWB86150.1 urea transporter [Mycetocola zhujimingii]
MSSTRSEARSQDSKATNWLLAFAHGVSQIFFQANLWTALLFLAAFVVADWRMALLVVLGCVAQTVTGKLLGVKTDDVVAGLQGFCGALVGAATFTILGGQLASYPIAIIGGALCAPITLLFIWLFTKTPLKIYGLPATTAPFCIVATIILLSTVPLHVSSSPELTTNSEVLAFFRSVLTNASQVVLIDNVWAGALILIGLFVANWKVGIAAVLGSVVGSLCALALQETLTETANGLAGYSGVLTAIALSVTFLKSNATSWILAVIGTIITALVTLLMHRLGAPTYTWPYILTTWVFLVIAHYIPSAKKP